MSFNYVKEVISPDVLKDMYSLSPEQKKAKELRDKEVQDIIKGESDKLLVIIGPCSADHEDPVCI